VTGLRPLELPLSTTTTSRPCYTCTRSTTAAAPSRFGGTQAPDPNKSSISNGHGQTTSWTGRCHSRAQTPSAPNIFLQFYHQIYEIDRALLLVSLETWKETTFRRPWIPYGSTLASSSNHHPSTSRASAPKKSCCARALQGCTLLDSYQATETSTKLASGFRGQLLLQEDVTAAEFTKEQEGVGGGGGDHGGGVGMDKIGRGKTNMWGLLG
jgi:hypothetical protein